MTEDVGFRVLAAGNQPDFRTISDFVPVREGITPVPTLERAKAIADAEGLHYVYIGNVPGHPAQNTYCPKCHRMLVERVGFTASRMLIRKGSCPFCGQPIPGIWHA